MEIYDRLIENPLFFKWIFHPSSELNAYWSAYLEQNPQETDIVLEFKSQFEKYLKCKDETLKDTDKRKLAYRIVKQLEKIDRSRNQVVIFRNLLKYAAVALLFFSLGSGLVYLYLDNRPSEILTGQNVLPSQVAEPTLIIGDNQKIRLNSGASQIDYTRAGEIVFNQEETVKRESGKTPEMNTLVIPYGSRSVITLADGSRVWLNAGSRLIYPSAFTGKQREVFLVGEAFFDIAKHESQSFLVKTADLEIKALGTRFNVSAYPEDFSVQTALAEGSVELSRTHAGRMEKRIQLTPGKLAYFNKKNEETHIYNVDIAYYTLWTEGLFCFSNTDLNRIIRKLERYYDIRFQFDDPLKASIQISGKLDITKEKEVVFEYLSNLTGLDFEKLNANNYVIK